MAHVCKELILDVAGFFRLTLGFLCFLQFLDFAFKLVVDHEQHLVPVRDIFFQRQYASCNQQRKRSNSQEHKCADRRTPFLGAL